MSQLRRVAMPALAGLLVAGIGLASVPASAQPSQRDSVIAPIEVSVKSFGIFATSEGALRMGPDEFLEFAPFSGQPGAYVVRVYDSAGESLGRPLLYATVNEADPGSCLPAKVLTAQLLCTFSADVTKAEVFFPFTTGPTNVAIMDGAPLSLGFTGSAGDDYVVGGAGNDTLLGQGGSDRLYGGAGDDYLDGQAGDDYLEGEQGRDDMRGGVGSNSLDAADGIADIRVDCGGPPGPLFDFDEALDMPTNCGPNPTPIPPGPVEPIDPPVPGQAEGTIDGVPTNVEVRPDVLNEPVFFSVPQGPIFNTGLLWLGPTSPMPTFPLNSLLFPVEFRPLLPNTTVLTSIWSVGGPIGPTAARSARTAPLESVEIRVNAQGVAQGNVPVPQGQEPGNFVMQVNGVTASGGQMSINVGVALAEETPQPDPGPDESITIASATRGKGKQAATITVRGATTGLAGTPVSARYKLDRTKGWATGASVTVKGDGTYVLRVKTLKKVRIQVVSGAIRSPGVVVPAANR